MSRPAAGRKILLSIAILLVMAVAAGGGGFVLLRSRPGEDVLASRAAPGGAGGTAATAGGIRIPGEGGGPLFRFGNPYLDGRSGWLAARFLEARARARDCPLPDAPVVSAGVHRAPFSGGPWLESLPADIASQLCADLTVLCEANLAGDVVLVMSKVEQFTQAYKRNRKPVGSAH